MATPVMMPKVGISVESCILTEWHKKKGDAVKVGDLLFTYETDKSTIDETSEAEGILLEQFAKEGDDVPVMTNVCVIGQEGESTAEFAPAKEEEPEEAAEEAPGCCSGYNSCQCTGCAFCSSVGRWVCQSLPACKTSCRKDRDGSALCSADRCGRPRHRTRRPHAAGKRTGCNLCGLGCVCGCRWYRHWRTVCCCGYRNGSGSSACSGRSGAGIHR